MRYGFLTLLIFILTWLLWATFSTGGLYQLKQMNPEYAYPHKSVPYLLSKLSYSESSGLWDSYHVKHCWVYMPNWTKAEECVKERLYCEIKAPPQKEKFMGKSYPDIFSDEFDACEENNRPFMGFTEWLRASRTMLRASFRFGAMWLTGGFEDRTIEEQTKWDEQNKYWAIPLIEWVDKGQ